MLALGEKEKRKGSRYLQRNGQKGEEPASLYPGIRLCWGRGTKVSERKIWGWNHLIIRGKSTSTSISWGKRDAAKKPEIGRLLFKKRPLKAKGGGAAL